MEDEVNSVPHARVEEGISGKDEDDGRHDEGEPGSVWLESGSVWQEFFALQALLLHGIVEPQPGCSHELTNESVSMKHGMFEDGVRLTIQFNSCEAVTKLTHHSMTLAVPAETER